MKTFATITFGLQCVVLVALLANAYFSRQIFKGLFGIYRRLERLERAVFHKAIGGFITFDGPLTKEVCGMPGAIGVIKSVGGTVTGTPNFTDAQGNTVPAQGLNPTAATADASKVTAGTPDPVTGATVFTGIAPTGVNPDGTPATVLVSITGTNPDGTTDVLSGAVQVADDAVGGTISFA